MPVRVRRPVRRPTASFGTDLSAQPRSMVPPLVGAGRLAYAGVSAGAMLAGPDLMHCIDPAEPDPRAAVLPSTRGLGIAPVIALPHANRAGRDLLHARVISALGERFEFVRITDEQAIVIQGDHWTICPSPGL